MPLTRDQADSMIRSVRLTFDGTDGDLNLTYRPNLLSRAEFRRLQELGQQDEAETDNGIAPLLCRVIVGWDFLDEHGQPYPVDADTLGTLGYGVQQEIVGKMIAGNSPTPTNGRRSGGSTGENRILPAIESTSQTERSSSSSPNTTEERSLSSY